MTAFAGLAARIEHALADADRLVPRIATLADRAARDDDFAVIDALALNLQGLYTGLEQIFESIAREIDGAVPEGPNWHRDLLTQMAGAVSGGRSSIISAASFACLDDLRGFRHVVRNVYAHHLDPDRVTHLAARALACYGALRAELDQFAALLAQAD